MPNYLLQAGFQTNAIAAAVIDAAAIEKVHTGIRVDRVAGALPATTTLNIFSVTGTVLLTGFLGVVGTVIQTQTCNLKVSLIDTLTSTTTDICANLNVSAKAAGSLFTITGTLATALQSGLVLPAQAAPVILVPGTVILTTSATNTGTVAWSVWYHPLTTGASMTAL